MRQDDFIYCTIKEIARFPGRDFETSTEESKNSSEVSFHSSELSFHSSEVLFRPSVENFWWLVSYWEIPLGKSDSAKI